MIRSLNICVFRAAGNHKHQALQNRIYEGSLLLTRKTLVLPVKDESGLRLNPLLRCRQPRQDLRQYDLCQIRGLGLSGCIGVPDGFGIDELRLA